MNPQEADIPQSNIPDAVEHNSEIENSQEQTTFVSPKKKSKLFIGLLRSSSARRSACNIGSILQLPQLHNGIIRRGEVRDIKLSCTVTDNRAGRMPGDNAARNGRRFIYLADYTGFMNLGMIASETGIVDQDTESESCVESTRSFFTAKVTGTVAWIPTRGTPDRPTFFLNNGYIKRIDVQQWSGDMRFALPTSDACKQMVMSAFASSARFMTTGFCGRIDICCENTDGEIVMSMEGPFGSTAMEVLVNNPGITNKAFMESNNLSVGTYIFIKGDIEIQGMVGSENAVLKVKSESMECKSVEKLLYDTYVKMCMETDVKCFGGVVPEYM